MRDEQYPLAAEIHGPMFAARARGELAQTGAAGDSLFSEGAEIGAFW